MDILYLIYRYSIEIQISDIVYYKVCSKWYTKHFIFESSLASQNCFVALWHIGKIVLMLSTPQIEEVLQNCLIWENRKHYTKLRWSVLQLQLRSTTPLQENYNFNLTYNYTLYNHNCNLQPNYISLHYNYTCKIQCLQLETTDATTTAIAAIVTTTSTTIHYHYPYKK